MSKKIKIAMFIINIIISVFIVIMDIMKCFVINEIIYKQIASGAVCLLSSINLIICIIFFNKKTFWACFMLFLGVIIGSVGDFVIGKNFILGAALFAVGHIFYIIALYFISRFTWYEILVSLCVIGISLIVVFIPYVDYGNYLILVVIYAIILSLMLSKCLSNLFFNKKDLLNIILVIAGLLFYFSDLMLMLYIFKSADLIFDKLCLMLYLPAQILFAVSIFIALMKRKNILLKK